MPSAAIATSSHPCTEGETESRVSVAADGLSSLRTAMSMAPLGCFMLLVVAGMLWSGDAGRQDLAHRLQPPLGFGGLWSDPLGTDSLGRDVLLRVMEASKLSLTVGVLAAGLSALIGVVPGLVAGIVGGWFDMLVTAVVELVLAVPTIVIGLIVAATVGQNLTNVVLLLALTGWIGYARVARIQARSLSRADFVLAAVAIGAPQWRIARFHVLPNVMPQMLVLFCQQVAAAMIWEASLTYLGIGLPIERISLGGMIREGQQQVFEAPWIGLAPGLAIALAVVGFSLLAEESQRWIDPMRTRRKQRLAWPGRSSR